MQPTSQAKPGFFPQETGGLKLVTGETGQRIIRAIVAGERDPHKLAAMRDYRCQKDELEIAKALTGNWRPEHLFVLKQSLALYDDIAGSKAGWVVCRRW